MIKKDDDFAAQTLKEMDALLEADQELLEEEAGELEEAKD
jgi:hypothetical protein